MPSPSTRAGGFEFERYIHYGKRGGEYTQLAIGFDYEGNESLIDDLRDLEWDATKASWNPDYQFKSGREGAWTVGTSMSALSTVKRETGLSLPALDGVRINRDPFNEPSKRIRVGTRTESELSYECGSCGEDGVLSALEYERVYNSASGLRSELLLDETNDVTHMCEKCGHLLHVPIDERTPMGVAMGEPEAEPTRSDGGVLGE